MSPTPLKKRAFFVFPETAEEMLCIVEAYSLLVPKYPETELELVLYFWSLRPAEVAAVLDSQDRRTAAERRLAHYVDRLD